MKKVSVLVLNNFTNDSRVIKTCSFLQALNFHVRVIALHDKGLLKNENFNGSHIERVSLMSRDLPKMKFLQLFKYFEWVFQSLWKVRGSDVIHCNDLNTLPVGVIYKIFSFGKVKCVYDAHEFESNHIPNQSRFSVFILRVIEYLLIRFSDVVITVSNGIAEEYSRIYKIKKPYLVMNCPPYKDVLKGDSFRDIFKISKDKKIFLYQGALNKGRGVEIILEVFSNLNLPVVIVFMGYGDFVEEIKEKSLLSQTVFFHPAVAPADLLNFTSSADFGISLIENLCLSYFYCLPNKFFEYIMAGIPVIVSDLPEMKLIVEKYNIGVVAKDNQSQGLLEAINVALSLNQNDIAKNISEVKKIYCWELQEMRLKEIYSQFI